MADLQVIERSLRNHYADFIADAYVQKLIRQVELFGFHLALLTCASTARSTSRR